jgi:heme/copper-type cytochrome/quinol oxidase subunit 1
VSGTFAIVTAVSVILVASRECDPRGRAGHRRGMGHLKWLTTTDRKTIGSLYLITSFAFFCIGGVMALLMRAELARPGLQIMSNESRKPMFGYMGLIAATIAIAGLSVTVWAHHMYVTGGVLLPFFSFMTFLIAVPTGVKFFNWIGTMWNGSLSFETPMLWATGFLVTFVFGGLTG